MGRKVSFVFGTMTRRGRCRDGSVSGLSFVAKGLVCAKGLQQQQLKAAWRHQSDNGRIKNAIMDRSDQRGGVFAPLSPLNERIDFVAPPPIRQ